MDSGQEHENDIKVSTLPIGIIISLIFDIQTGILFAIVFFISGLWLSPDLDTLSKPLKRWGIIKFLWWPYRKLIPHRSILSHGPFIGTTIRLCYLIGMFTIIIKIININILTSSLNPINEMSNLISKYPRQFKIIFFGTEASAWLHLIKDKYS